MPGQRIEYEGKVHEFPDDFSQADIAKALKTYGQPAQPAPVASPDLLDPATIDQHTTVVAKTLAERLTRPALPTPTPGMQYAPPSYQIGLDDPTAPQAPRGAMPVSLLKRVPGTETYRGPVPATKVGFEDPTARPFLNVPGAKPEGERMAGATLNAPSVSMTRRAIETPIVTPEDVDENFPFLVGPFRLHAGLLKAGAAMTTPENAAITAATGGLGAVRGVTAAVVRGGLSAYFATGAGKALKEKYPQIKDAVKAKDWQGALELGGGALADAAIIYGAGKHAAGEIFQRAPAEARANYVKKVLGETEYRANAEKERVHSSAPTSPLNLRDPEAGVAPEPQEPVGTQTETKTPEAPPTATNETPAPEMRAATQPGNPPEKPPVENSGKITAEASNERTDTGRAGGALHGDAPSGSRSLSGEETSVAIPGEKRAIPARYEVRELSDIKPSHNGNTFSANPDYELKNERDYSKPENQQRVIEQSSDENFDPRYHINTVPDLSNGPALIDEHGNVIGGNSRTMHQQRVFARDGKAAADYRELLEKNAHHFGIDPEQIRGMKQPILTRVATTEGLDALPGGSKWAVRKTNVSGTAALSASERAAADAGQMSPELIGHIAGAIENAGPDATLNDALTGKTGTSIVNRLISDGFFSEQERPQLMDGKTGALTQIAKDRISKAMLGQFFRDSDQISRTPASLRNKLERVAAPVAKVSGDPAWDVTPEIREAVDLIEYANAHDIKNLSDVVSQESMFGEAPKWSDGAIKIAELLRDGKPNDVVNAFRKYVNSKDAGAMFGESTPKEAFQDVFGAEKPKATTQVEAAATPVEAKPPAPQTPEPSAAVPQPDPAPAKPTTLASGFGALQPYYDSLVKSLKESAAEASALNEKRRAAIAAAKAGEPTELMKEVGRTFRQHVTGERDLWGVRVNQVIAKLRRFMPDHTEQEALSLMRDFKSRPGELEQFLRGDHPDLHKLPPDEYQVAMEQLEKLRPAIEKALNPTPKMLVADGVLSQIADMTLKEGQRIGFLESSISPDEYVTHLLHPKGEGETPGKAALGQFGQLIGGKIGRNFSFGKERTIPTLAHAVAYGLKPKTLNALDAFTIHGDKFATARATHMLVQEFKDAGVGKWGARAGQGNIPADWVEIAPHAHPFQNVRAFTDTEGNAQIARQTLFVPKHIADALRPITDPNFMHAVLGYKRVRVWQAAAKAAELSLSVFHLKAENYMALSNMGVKGWLEAQKADRWSNSFLEAERDMVLHGGTSSIQGRTFEAYKSLQPGSIPTRIDVIRKLPGIAQFDKAAGHLTDFIFDNQVRKFKVTNYALRKASWLAENPNATATETSKALHSIASEINAVYGGLHWENLGVNRMTQDAARFIMLAPDWTISNFFNVATMAEGGIRGGGLRGKTEGARMSRAFWLRAIVGGMAVNQGYSLLMGGKLSKNPFMAYEGTDSDGREVYRNVAFAGAPSDVVNLIHNVVDYGVAEGTFKSLVGKAAPGFRTAFELAFNEDFRHHAITDPKYSWLANNVRGGLHLTKGLLPIPFTATNLIDVANDGNADEKEKAKEIIGLIIFGQASRHVAPEGTRWSATRGLRPDNRQPSDKSFWDQVNAQ